VGNALATMVSVAGDAGQVLWRQWSSGWRFALTIVPAILGQPLNVFPASCRHHL